MDPFRRIEMILGIPIFSREVAEWIARSTAPPALNAISGAKHPKRSRHKLVISTNPK